MERRTYYFSGRVQGVGFRYTVANVAIQHDVRGYVKNLTDGRVELTVEGHEPEIDLLVDEVGQRMQGFIRKIDHSSMPATGEFEQFYIRH